MTTPEPLAKAKDRLDTFRQDLLAALQNRRRPLLAASSLWSPRCEGDNPGEGTVEVDKPAGEISVIRFDGSLTARPDFFERMFMDETMGTTEKLMLAVQAADRTPGTIVLDMSTGGGAVERVLDAQAAFANTSNRLVVWASTMLSGGVVVASGADARFGPPTAVAGSMSVAMMRADETEALAQQGITVEIVAADGDELKKTAGGGPIDKPRRDLMQRNATSTKAAILPVVAQGLGMELADLKKVANGDVFIGQEAVDAGFLDGTFQSFDDFLASERALLASRSDTSQPDKEEAAMAHPDNEEAKATAEPVASASPPTLAETADAVERLGKAAGAQAAALQSVKDAVLGTPEKATEAPLTAKMLAESLGPALAAAVAPLTERLDNMEAKATAQAASATSVRIEALGLDEAGAKTATATVAALATANPELAELHLKGLEATKADAVAKASALPAYEDWMGNDIINAGASTLTGSAGAFTDPNAIAARAHADSLPEGQDRAGAYMEKLYELSGDATDDGVIVLGSIGGTSE